MERAILDLLTASHERDKDGSSVTQCQANDTNTREGVESGGSTEVDETESDLDHHAEHHGVDWDIEVGVDDPPQLVAGNGTVTREGPGSARRSCRAADTAKQTEDEKGNKKSDGTSGGPYGFLDDDRRRLAGQKTCEHGLVGQYEDERDKKDEAGNGVKRDGRDHGLGDLSGRFANFFAHATNVLAFGQLLLRVTACRHV